MMLRNISEMNLLVRSKDRDRVQGAGDSAEFRLSLSEAISGNYRLIWATVPNACYNLNSKNNKLYLNSTQTGDVTITIPSENYTGETLADRLQSLLVAQGFVQPGQTLGVAYLDNRLKLQLTLSAGQQFKIYTRRGEDSAHAVLGFPTSAQDELFELTPGQATVLPQVVALGLPTSLGIRIKEASSLAYMTGGNYEEVSLTGAVSRGTKAHSASLIIPFLASAGGYQSSAQDRHVQSVLFPTLTKYLHIQVCNPDTRDKVDLNGADWEMLLSKA